MQMSPYAKEEAVGSCRTPARCYASPFYKRASPQKRILRQGFQEGMQHT
jgi:hypothetical protein